MNVYIEFPNLTLSKKIHKLNIIKECSHNWYWARYSNSQLGDYKKWQITENTYEGDYDNWDNIIPTYAISELMEALKDKIAYVRPCNAGYEVHRYIDLMGRDTEFTTDKKLSNALAKMLIHIYVDKQTIE